MITTHLCMFSFLESASESAAAGLPPGTMLLMGVGA